MNLLSLCVFLCLLFLVDLSTAEEQKDALTAALALRLGKALIKEENIEKATTNAPTAHLVPCGAFFMCVEAFNIACPTNCPFYTCEGSYKCGCPFPWESTTVFCTM